MLFCQVKLVLTGNIFLFVFKHSYMPLTALGTSWQSTLAVYGSEEMVANSSFEKKVAVPTQ